MKFGYLWTYGSEDALPEMRQSLLDAGCAKLFEDTQEPSTFAERKLLQQALAEVTTGDRLLVCELAALGAMRDVMAVVDQLERVGAGLQIISGDIDTLAPGGAMALRALRAASEIDGTLRGKAVKARAWHKRGGSDCQVIFNNAGALAGSSTFIFDASSRLGVGEATPDAKLHVGGEVIVANTGLTCSATTEGAIRYDTTDNHHEFCDGGNWVPMDSLYGGGGSDVTPNYFDFNDVTNAAISTVISSNIVLIHGIDAAASIVIGGDGTPEYRICSDATCGTVVQTWTSVSNTIDNGEFLQVRLTSSSSPDTARIANPVTVGTLTVNWQVTTIGPKRVFITSTQYDGDLGGFSGADAKCQARAAAAGLSGTYKAWLSDDYETAASRLVQSPYNYVLPNGTIVANSWSDLTDSSLDAAITRDEFGTNDFPSQVWTGTAADGTLATGDHCNHWTSDISGFHNGRIGNNSSTTATWTTDMAAPCNASLQIYCFEQ